MVRRICRGSGEVTRRALQLVLQGGEPRAESLSLSWPVEGKSPTLPPHLYPQALGPGAKMVKTTKMALQGDP